MNTACVNWCGEGTVFWLQKYTVLSQFVMQAFFNAFVKCKMFLDVKDHEV